MTTDSAARTPIAPNPDWRPEDAVAWLEGGGRFAATPAELLDGLSKALLAAGAPLIRSRFTFRTLHPLIRAITVKWWPDKGATDELGSLHGLEHQPKFVGSPVSIVMAEDRPLRRRLDELNRDADHRVLFEIRDEGGVDYLAAPVRFAGPGKGMMAIVLGEGAFSDAQIAGFETLCDRVAPILEAMVQRRIAETLLETYTGRRSGKRVLSGQVKRGDAEPIQAVFWYSDLRNFTRLTEDRPIEDVLNTVNRYFELVWAEAQPRGGEIISLIGDAILMMFPVSENRTSAEACAAALETARAALAAAGRGLTLRFGVGLHYGGAIYGNIGAPDRLDFTVMGAAVNRTARLESLTKEIGVPILASATFMAHIDEDADACGAHAVKGVPQPMEIFAPSVSSQRST